MTLGIIFFLLVYIVFPNFSQFYREMVDIPRCLSLRQAARWFDFHVSRSPRRVQLTSVFSQRRREKERKKEHSGKQSPREGGSQDYSLDRLAAPYTPALAGVAQCGSRHGTRSQPEASPLSTIFLHYPEKKIFKLQRQSEQKRGVLPKSS